MAPCSSKDRPLRSLAEAFDKLAREFEQTGNVDLRLDSLIEACSRISVLLGRLGIAFKFAEQDYVSKVEDLLEASKQHETLQSLFDNGVHYGSPTTIDRHIRSVFYVKRGADMVKVLFNNILESRHLSLRECASKAYEEVFAPYHTWAIRKAVTAGMYTLPSKGHFLRKIHEEVISACAADCTMQLKTAFRIRRRLVTSLNRRLF
ncbi:hypothetical protein O6H91_04G075400 [Diphasiastrum complanatum]|uniref:Uncharacterized protein n=1 Tax=Diphasiastrum complanatum TaxID=34168 RepID=A0ACC2DYC1_DIPCM|nr:hypothetical protein O6H91_04G075400 [Diphasiastrum complanatum]